MEMTSILAQQIWNGVVSGMAYALFAMGLTLIFGILKVINMAHGEVYMLGAMVFWTFIEVLKLNFLYSLLLSVGAIGIIGVIISYIGVRPLINEGLLPSMLSTLAISYILIYSTMLIWGVDTRVISTPFTGKFLVFGAIITKLSIVLLSIGLGTMTAVSLFLAKTTMGKAMRATAQDRIGAYLVGLDVQWIFTFTMILSSALAAVGGVIVGSIWTSHPSMGLGMILKGYAVIIVSGMGSLPACIATAFLLGITEAIFGHYVSMLFRDGFAYGLMLIVCLLRPQGLFAQRQNG
jgi:branched-chain amino acid transport system permease protein